MKVIKIDLQDGKFIDVVVENEDAASQLEALLSWCESARKELVEAVDFNQQRRKMMSKIGSLVFDSQEQEDAEFFDGDKHKQHSESLVNEFAALVAAYAAYHRRIRKLKIKPVVAELNFYN